MSVVNYKGKEYKATGSNLMKVIRLDDNFNYNEFDSVEKYFRYKGIIFTNYTVSQGADLFDGFRENAYTSSKLILIFSIYARYGMNTDRIRKDWVINLLEKRKGKRNSNTEGFYKDYFEEEYAEAQAKCRNLPPNNYNKETWVKLGYSAVDAEARVEEQKDKTSGSLKSFCSRYGEELGIQKHIEFRNNVSYSNTIDYYIEAFGKKEGTERYKAKNSKNSFTSSYEGHKQNGTLDEYAEINNRRAVANKYETLVEKFGETRAREILFARAGFARTKRHKSSKAAYKFFLPIYKFLRKNGIDREDILWGVGSSNEKTLYNERSKLPKLYDFCIESLKIIIEFDGAAWHPQQGQMTKDEWAFWKTPFGKSADEQYNNDRLKDTIAEKHGFFLFRVHEDDKDIKQKEILEILKGRIYENNEDIKG